MSLQNCLLSGGYTLGCSQTGGVNRVWIGNYEQISAYTQDNCGIITGITPTSAITVYEFAQDIQTASLVQTGSYDRSAGTVFYESVLSIKLFGLDCTVRNLLVELGRSPLMAIVESNAGDFYYLGISSAGRTTTGEANLGLNLGDMNGASISISWLSPDGVFVLDPALLGTTILIG